jgi:hypothetical protein
MMTTKEKGRRSQEEKRHGGCAERKGRTLAQQERRKGRKGPQACKASSVRYPVRALPGKRRDWLQRQDSNLRHRGYEPRGMTASLRCGKTGAPSFCGLHGTRNSLRPVTSIRPVAAEPANNLVILFGGEGLPASDSGKETTIGRAMPADRGFAKILGLTKGVRKRQQMIGELRFHAALIVGRIPLCNRKHPIRVWRGKFPIMQA